MKAQIARLARGGHSPKGWHPAYVIAVCDGYRVRCIGNGKGWDCQCPDPECPHLNAVAEIIAPEVLEELELDSDHELREARKPKPPAPVKPRRKRVTS